MVKKNTADKSVLDNVKILSATITSNESTHGDSKQQKIDLQDYINDPETHYEPDYGRGWDIYCNILTVEQIQLVGF